MKNNKTLKRFLAFLLSAAMLVTYMPSPVFTLADESADSPEVAADNGDSGSEAKKEAPKKSPAPAAAPAEQAEPAPAPEPEAPAEPKESQVEEAKEPETPETRAGPSDDSDVAEEANEEANEEAIEETSEEASEEAVLEDEEVVEEEADEEEKEDEDKLNEKTLTFTGNANSVNVRVVAQPGTFPEGTTMKVVSVSKGAVRDAVEDALDDVNDFRAVDITFYADGKEVQPKKNVSVKLTTYAFDSDEDLSVVHIENSGAAEVMGLTSASDTAAQFRSDSFSIYVVVETGEDARLIVNFKRADGSTATMMINERQIDQINQYIFDPGAHEPQGSVFKGWTSVENYDKNTKALTISDIRKEIKEKLEAGVTDGTEVTYYAMAFKSYEVTYLDERGIIVQIDQDFVKVDSSENPTHNVTLNYTPYPPEDEGVSSEFKGWQQISPKVEGERVLYNPGDSFELNEENYILQAYTQQGHWLSFDENLSAATYTEPQFVQINEKPVAPGAPTRAGYTFDGWYTEDASSERNGQVAGVPFDFNSDLEKNTTVYAKWNKAQTANYTVIIWTQDLDGEHYDYDRSISVNNAAVGSIANAVTTSGSGNNAIASVSGSAVRITGFHYDHHDTNVEVAAEGNTVVNVYYNRNEHTFTFRNNNRTIHTVTRLYGQDISDIWSFTGSDGRTYPQTNPPTSWTPSGSQTYTARITRIEVMPDEDITFTHTTTSNTTRYFHYYVEALPGATDTRTFNGRSYSLYTDLVNDFNIVYYNDDFWNLKGFNRQAIAKSGNQVVNLSAGGNISWTNLNNNYGGQNNHLYFYYTRNNYEIVYNDGVFVDGSGNPVKGAVNRGELTNLKETNVPYQSNIGNMNKKPQYTGYVFLGWYDNESCSGSKYNFGTMPANNVTLYAKWGQAEYEVKLHPNDSESDPIQYTSATQAEQFWAADGEKIGNVGGERIYYDLIGWYTDEGFKHPFDFGSFTLNEQMVGKYGHLYSASEINPQYPTTIGEINLYAKWRGKLVGSDGIRVEYVDGENGTGATYTDPSESYVDGAHANAHGSFTPADPDKYVFSHWEVQKWNGSAYVPSGQIVFPGEAFEIKSADAKITDEEGNVKTADQLDKDGTYTYTIQVKAVYIEKDKEVKTFINFYNNYNGGKVASYENIKINQAVKIPDAPKRDGYVFKGWIRGIEENGPTTTLTDLFIAYEDGAYAGGATQVAADENLVGDGTQHHALYAKWEPISYTVKFDKNADDAAGTMADQKFKYDEEKSLNANAFSRTGYVFLGWNTDKDAKTAEYADKQSVKNLTKEDQGVVTLYAIWLEKAEIDTSDADAKFAIKKVSGEGFNEAEFAFSIAPVGNAPAPEKTSGKVTATKAGEFAIDFGKITFSEAGNYEYTITETSELAKGWTCETKSGTAKVSVTDNGEGKLVAVADGLTIENRYKAESVDVDTDDAETTVGTKVVAGEGFKETEFAFSIAPVGDAPAPTQGTATVKAAKADDYAIDFGTITFTEVGEYEYTITETSELTKGWSCKENSGTAIINVTDDGKGQLVAEVTGVSITNTYKAESVDVDTDDAKTTVGTKVVAGEGFKSTDFEFSIAPVGDAPAPTKTSGKVTATKAGNIAIDFGTITFEETGVFQYTVTETTTLEKGWSSPTADQTATATITVTDNGEGQLVASVQDAKIQNNYETSEVIVDTDDAKAAVGTKKVSGEDFNETEFAFSIEPVGDAPAPTKANGTVKASAAGDFAIDFGTITFTEEGDYEYTITETSDLTKGWSCEENSGTATISVTDNGEGQLVAEVSGVTIENSYMAEPVEVDTDEPSGDASGDAVGTKKVSGEGFKEAEFAFSIAAVGDAPAPTKTTATVKAAKEGNFEIDFGTIKFEEKGTYEYTITETSALAKGWTCETKSGKAVIEVTDNGEGQLKAEVKGVTIENSYKADPVEVDTDEPSGDASGDAVGTKKVSGEGFKSTDFAFTIAPVDEAPAPTQTSGTVKATKADDYAIDFGTIKFSEAGDYEYTITETTELAKGWTCENKIGTATISVTDNGEGQLKAEVKGATIENSYKAEPVEVDTDEPSGDASGDAVGTKKVSGESFNETEFAFSIVPVGTAPAPSQKTAAVKAAKADDYAIDFGTIKFEEKGTYEYTIAETSELTKGWTCETKSGTATIEVTDNGEGQLVAVVKGVTIENSYKAEPVEVDTDEPSGDASGDAFATKVVEGEGFEAKAFDFSITAGEGSPAVDKDSDSTEEFDKAGSEKLDFGTITFTEAGEFTYTVQETTKAAKGWTMDAEPKTVTVKVTDNGQGQLKAEVTGAEIKNSYKAEPVTVDTKDPEDDENVTGTPFVTKTVSGTGFDAQAFDFELTVADGEEAAATMKATTDKFAEAGSKAVDFGKITYSEAGTYTYTVKETTKATKGWKNDNAEKTITVEVTDDGKGQLKAEVTGVEVKNSYKAEPVTVDTDDPESDENVKGSPFVTKTVSGEGFKAKAFDFNITAVGEAPKPAAATASTEEFSKEGSKTVDFGSIKFDEAGEFKYTVQETTEETKGWSNDNTAKTVTVKVTDNGKGQLEAVVSGVTVTNAYSAEGVPVVPSDFSTAFVKKTVSGKDFDPQAFEFSIAVAEGSPANTPKPAEAKASTDEFAAAGTKTVNFAPITFTKAGTYTYTVQEITKATKGWTNDNDAKTVKVIITDDGEGQLEAKVEGVEVKNSYKAEPVEVDTDDPSGDASGSPFVTKKVEGEGFKAQAFSFSLTAGEGSPAVDKETASTEDFTAAGEKAVDLGKITFTEAGTFTYTVKETTEATKGWTNDNAEKTVTVKVTDDGKGQLKAEVIGATVKNSYKAEPVEVDTDDPSGDASGNPFVTKTVEGKGFDAQAFDFSITADEGSPAVDKASASTDKFTEADSKTVDLGKIKFTEAGTFTYTVKETTKATKGWTNDNADKTVTVEVTDDGEGQLKAEVTGVTVKNSYKAEPVEVDTDDPSGDASGSPFVTKTVEGNGFDAQAFNFSITADEGSPAVDKASADTDEFTKAGSKAVDLGKITFTEAGEFTYTVKETTEATKGWTNDNAAKKVTVKVTDDGKGQLKAEVTGATVKNSYKAEPVTVDTDDPESSEDVTGKPFATKIVEGPGFDPQAFDFSITAGEGSPAADNATASTGKFKEEGSKAVDFGKITFTEAGEYTYTVKETTKAGKGWKNDNADKTITVKVTDDGKGQLKAEVEGVEVTNRFTASPAISVTKAANRTSGLRQGDSVRYTITVKNTGNVTLTGINVTDSLVKFKGNTGKNIKLAPGKAAKITYNYTVTAADVRAGRVVNTATARGTAPDGSRPSDSDRVTATTRGNGGGGGNPGGGGGNPGGPVVTPGDGDGTPGDGTAVVPDQPVPEVEPEVDIVDPETPLAGGAWALVNLICAILTALGAIVALFRKKEEDDEEEDEEGNAKPKTDEEEDEEDDNRGKKMLAAKIAGAIAGVAGPVAFILTEDITLPMIMIDKWTLLMVIILAAQIVAAILNKKASKLDDEEEEEEAGAAAN